MSELRGARILITGPAGQVAFPLARSLARDNDVVGVARFSRAGDRERLEAVGVRCVAADLGSDALDAISGDVDVVLHFAVAKSRNADFDADLTANAEGTGRLMSRCRRAKAFLLCSSTGVYQDAGHAPLTETSPLGDNHRVIMTTYSICKIATEAVARFGAREWNLPTTNTSSPKLSIQFVNGSGLRFTAARAPAFVAWPLAATAAPRRPISTMVDGSACPYDARATRAPPAGRMNEWRPSHSVSTQGILSAKNSIT